MRVSEGMINVFNWQGFDYCSYYHFNLPRICGFSSGAWVAKAFKGEFFVYKWSGDSFEKKLYNKTDFENFLLEYSGDVFSGDDEGWSRKVSSTFDLIKDCSQDIFKFLCDTNLKEELFYYRPLEQEFTRAK